ncbi:MAG TPA: hypothetical protein VHD83_24110 [Puia sp.]|nr:hypothetical protein [Puia sp.]
MVRILLYIFLGIWTCMVRAQAPVKYIGELVVGKEFRLSRWQKLPR